MAKLEEQCGKPVKKICLMGAKHTGKTTTGAALVRLYGGTCLDLDAVLASQTGKSPRRLYRESPALFQEAESAALDYALSVRAEGLLVIATGGGIIDNPAACTRLKAADCLAICLALRTDSAWQRIKAAPLPPFLQTDNPQESHRILHERRSNQYRSFAQLVIDADDKTPDHLAHEIMERTGLARQLGQTP